MQEALQGQEAFPTKDVVDLQQTTDRSRCTTQNTGGHRDQNKRFRFHVAPIQTLLLRRPSRFAIFPQLHLASRKMAARRFVSAGFRWNHMRSTSRPAKTMEPRRLRLTEERPRAFPASDVPGQPSRV